MISREQEAGQLYSNGLEAVSTGGHELRMLAMHLILMVKGTVQFPGALWPVRELRTGKVVRLDRFIDYLMEQPRDGLGLPSLHFLKRTLEATPEDGDRAITLVRSELAKEHVDFDKVARDEGVKLHGEREPLAEYGTNQYTGDSNTTSSEGRGAAYLAARLKRDHEDIAAQLAAGKFKSVRAAAIAAGIVTPPTPLEQIQKLWAKLTEDERKTFLADITRKDYADAK